MAMKKIFTFLFLTCSVLLLKGQDPEFTQFYANPLYLNPALAGIAKGPRMIVNYRNQWPSINTANFITYSASYDQHFDKIGGGIGFQVMYDQAGDGELNSTSASFAYSYHLNVNPNFAIKASIQAGVQQKVLDFSKLTFGDQLDARRGLVSQYSAENIDQTGISKMPPFADFSAGFVAFTNKFYGGAVVNHINKPKMSWLDDPKSILDRKLTMHVGMMIPLENVRRPDKFFSPNILFQKQGDFMQVNFGGYYIKDYFISGIWFRQTTSNYDALIFLVGFRRDQVKIGYSYDLTLSEARLGAIGSHELSITLELESRTRQHTSQKWRKLECPDL